MAAREIVRGHSHAVIRRSVAGAAAAFLAFFAFTELPLAQVYAILFATPILITLLAIPFLGETVRLRRGLAVAIGLAGVLIVLRPGAQPLQPGHLAALAAALLASVNAIIMRRIGGQERMVVMILYPMFTGFVIMGGALAFVYRPMPLADLGLLAVIAVLVLLAMMSILAAYRSGPAIFVAPMQYSQILWAVLLGALFSTRPPISSLSSAPASSRQRALYPAPRNRPGRVPQPPRPAHPHPRRAARGPAHRPPAQRPAARRIDACKTPAPSAIPPATSECSSAW